jgi:hypothetical protein
MFVIVMGCVLFEVQAEFLNIVYVNFSFKWLSGQLSHCYRQYKKIGCSVGLKV